MYMGSQIEVFVPMERVQDQFVEVGEGDCPLLGAEQSRGFPSSRWMELLVCAF